MSKIVIKKKVSFEFLGDEYKDSFLIFRSIPVKDYEQIMNDIEKLENDKKSSFVYLLDTLKKYFIEGEFLKEKVEVADLDEIDKDITVKSFQLLTGQVDIDPKVETPSTTPSTTDTTTEK